MSDAASDVVLIGLGNRFGGDDAIGPLVAHRIAERCPSLAVVEGAGDALAILDAWRGFERAVIVDAALTESGSAPGTVHRLDDGQAIGPKALARCSNHGGGLAEALALGEALGRRPTTLTVFAIEAASFAPGPELSPALAAVFDELVARVLNELDRDTRTTEA